MLEMVSQDEFSSTFTSSLYGAANTRNNSCMSDEVKTKIAYCNYCKQHTEHTIAHTLTYSKGNKEDIYCGLWMGWDYWYHLLQCNGCEDVSLLGSRFFSEWDRGLDLPEEFRFPPEKRCHEPDWFERLPQDIVKVLKEVYTAIQNNCLMLASTGIRTILDMVFVEKVGDQGGFEQKVNQMIKKGYLAQCSKAPVMAVIDTGSASAHRGFNPNIALLTRAIRITEGLLESVYIHPDDGDNLRDATPPRRLSNEST
jgi:hypothetical protein